jgi:hypothetical protein
LFQDSSLTSDTVECFVCYLAGHNRPIHEVLFSRDLDMEPAYENEFQGMTIDDVSLADLIATRERLRHELVPALTNEQKHFLLSLAAVNRNGTLCHARIWRRCLQYAGSWKISPN